MLQLKKKFRTGNYAPKGNFLERKVKKNIVVFFDPA